MSEATFLLREPSDQHFRYPPEVFQTALTTTGEPGKKFNDFFYVPLVEQTDMVPRYGDVQLQCFVSGFDTLPDIRTYDFAYKQEGKSVAELIFRRQPMSQGAVFIMGHRFVEPSARRKGMGTQLYSRAEEFLQGIAREMKTDIEITLGISQPNVMRWARTLGFEVRDEVQRAKVEDILQHPEKYVISRPEHNRLISESDRDELVFEADQRYRTKENALRFTFSKIISSSISKNSTETITETISAT